MKQQLPLILASALLFLLHMPAQAQQHLYRWRVGTFAGASTYYGDLNTQLLTPQPAWQSPQQHPNYWLRGIHLQNSFTRAWSWRLTAAAGRFQATDRPTDWDGRLDPNAPYLNRALNVETRYQHFGLSWLYDFNNGQCLDLDARVAPYLGIGLGLMRFTPYADLYTDNGQRYYYWSDGTVRDQAENSGNPASLLSPDNQYETALPELQTEGVDYNPNTLYFPLTFGLKFKLSERLHLNLEGNALYTLTDYLDDVSGDYPTAFSDPVAAYASNPSERSGTQRGTSSPLHDIVGQLSLGLYVNFGTKTYDFLPPVFFSSGGQQFDLLPIGLSANAGDSTAAPQSLPTTYDDIFKATNVTSSYHQTQAWQDTLALLPQAAKITAPIAQPTSPQPKASRDTTIRRKAEDNPQPADTTIKVINDTLINFKIDTAGQLSPIDTIVTFRTEGNDAAPIRRKAEDNPQPADTTIKVINDTLINFKIDTAGQLSPIDTIVTFRTEGNDAAPIRRKAEDNPQPADTAIKVINDTLINFKIDTAGQLSPIDTIVTFRTEGSDAAPIRLKAEDNPQPADTIIYITLAPDGNIAREDTTVIVQQEIVRDTVSYVPDTLLQQVERSRLEIARLQQRYQAARLTGDLQQSQTDSLNRALMEMGFALDEYRAQVSRQEVRTQGETDSALGRMTQEIAYLKQQLAQPALGDERAKAIATAEKAANDAKIKALEERIAAMEAATKQAEKQGSKADKAASPRRNAPVYILNRSRVDDAPRTEKEKPRRERPIIVNRSRMSADSSQQMPPRDSLAANGDSVSVVAPSDSSDRNDEVAPPVDSSRLFPLRGALFTPQDDDAPTPQPVAAVDTALQRKVAEQQTALAQKEEQIGALQQRLLQIEAQLRSKNQQTLQVEQQLKAQLDTLNSALAAVQAAQRQLQQETQSARQRAAALQGVERTNVYFASGSVAIARSHQLRLQEVAQAMIDFPELVASITGYADKSGNADLNAQLSQRRAEAVQAYLVAQGVAPTRLTVTHEGELPSAKTNDPFARRVEVVLQ